MRESPVKMARVHLTAARCARPGARADKTIRSTEFSQSAWNLGMSPDTPLLHKKDIVCTQLDVSPRGLENMVATGRVPRGVRFGRFLYWSQKNA